MPTDRAGQLFGTVVVTGGSRGIGAAISRLVASRGYRVALSFVSNAAAADRVVSGIAENGGQALAIRADVALESDILNLFAQAEAQLGPIVGLVNNAAVTGGFTRVDSVSAEALAKVFAVNVSGAILCAREAACRMSTRHGGQGGSIVNISSRAARIGSAGEWVHYAASKGAIDSFTLGLAREVATEGIRVNAVAPGLVNTDLANAMPDRVARLTPTIPMKRPGTVEEIAEAVLWLLSPQSSYTTGAILEAGGGR
jgi:NAD(P)-dependent dehydrogenase (short-subunit alcohol dehydrogenase family)